MHPRLVSSSDLPLVPALRQGHRHADNEEARRIESLLEKEKARVMVDLDTFMQTYPTTDGRLNTGLPG